MEKLFLSQKLWLVLFLVVSVILVGEAVVLYRLEKNQVKEQSLPTPTPTPVNQDISCLGNETEPEVFGNKEEPIPYGQKDAEGTGMAKLSQGGTIQIKGVVIVKNNQERALTLRIHRSDKIKVKVLPEAEWVVVIGDKETRPADFWEQVIIGDLFHGICVDYECTAVDHAAVIRSL